MKIWWQSSTPIHRLNDYRNMLTDHLNSVKRPDTEIDINGVDNGSMDLHYNAVVAMNSFAPGGVLNKIMQADDRGYDAVAIGCFLDPAMTEAREVVKIPVFGLGETSMMVACMYGQKFSGVAFHSKQAQYYDRKAAEYGLASRHVQFGDLGIDFTEVQKAFVDPGQMAERFIKETRRLAAQGAEVVLAACATVNAIIRREKIKEVDGCLVLDCNAVLLKMTEGMAELKRDIGLMQSPRLLYQGPTRDARNAWSKIYNFRASPQLSA
jgi:Asp/Glu/hydantoin racemase